MKSTGPNRHRDSINALALAKILALLLAPSTTAFAQVSWVQRTVAASPGERRSHRMAYDSQNQRVLLFGGENGFGTLNDTWTWDGTRWTQISSAIRPAPRTSPAFTFDSVRGRAVLFGGLNGSGTRADTWEWDGANWTEIIPTRRPGARVGSAFAFDAARGKAILFGGVGPGNSLADFRSDTWEWDGATWVQRAPMTVPPARAYGSMAYDSFRQRLVMFGGFNGLGMMLDTWEWDGNDWTPIVPLFTPSARDEYALAFDRDNRVILLFGGYDGSSFLGDTWQWNGADWSEFTPGGPSRRPPVRLAASMAYDESCGTVVLFGGSRPTQSGLLGDTWTINASPTVTALSPSDGSEEGGDIVHVNGTQFTDRGDLTVTFGGAPVEIVDVACNHLRVRTPPGTGAADVVIANSAGSVVVPAGYSYRPREIAARFGNVHQGLGDRENVLLVNGNTGNLDRELTSSLRQPIFASMQTPSSRLEARFVLYAWAAAPSPLSATTLPRGLGVSVFPTPFTGGTPQPLAIFNNLGHAAALGAPTSPSSPAPSQVFFFARGSRRAIDLAFQGVIQDDASLIPEGVSLTNAVILHVR
ncbi:MAG: IPT/TIG domain-containing protein [Planctomycetes bacterium]|nr:IPT/TIG domain-containing protein [Planctomycetota bacterium]